MQSVLTNVLSSVLRLKKTTTRHHTDGWILFGQRRSKCVLGRTHLNATGANGGDEEVHQLREVKRQQRWEKMLQYVGRTDACVTISGSDTVEQSRPRTEDRGCAWNTPTRLRSLYCAERSGKVDGCYFAPANLEVSGSSKRRANLGGCDNTAGDTQKDIIPRDSHERDNIVIRLWFPTQIHCACEKMMHIFCFFLSSDRTVEASKRWRAHISIILHPCKYMCTRNSFTFSLRSWKSDSEILKVFCSARLPKMYPRRTDVNLYINRISWTMCEQFPLPWHQPSILCGYADAAVCSCGCRPKLQFWYEWKKRKKEGERISYWTTDVVTESMSVLPGGTVL